MKDEKISKSIMLHIIICFTVCILIGKDSVQLQLQIEDPEHPNLVDDIADIERK